MATGPVDWEALDALRAANRASMDAGTWSPDFGPTIFDRHNPKQAARVAAFDAECAAYETDPMEDHCD